MVKDYLTKNRSSVQTVVMYDKSDLDDKDFCLTLLNENLIGVDPYDKSLSDELKKQIIEECEQNIWYFLREVVRVPLIGKGGEYSYLPLNIANVSAIWQSINSIDSYLVSPRQTYKDVTFTILGLWFNRFRNQNVTIFNGSMQEAERIECLLHSIIIPDYLDMFTNRENLIIYPKDTGILDELLQCEIQIFLNVNTLHYLQYVSGRIETKYKQNKSMLMDGEKTCFRLYVYGGVHSYNIIENIDTDMDFENKVIDSLEDNGYIIGRDGRTVSLLHYNWKDIGFGKDWYDYMCKCLNNDPIAIAKELDLKEPDIKR